MSDSSKRKAPPEERKEDRAVKRSKGGSGGKWQTPHQRAKAAATGHRDGGKIEPGDVGIWATCVKGKEGAATEELKGLFEEYVKCLYGVVDPDIEHATEQDVEDDIESSIWKEINSIAGKHGPAQLFTPVYLDLQCVLFFKTRPPIIPVDFVRRICEDASNNAAKKKIRFVNRLTPMTMIAKATEKGLEEVGKLVLGEHFQLVGEEKYVDPETEKKQSRYAIRPTFRNHSTLKRDIVINLVASLIGSNHKVDLTRPEKVIIVEIYQTICGMSVVGVDWENLKRYNLAEIYQQGSKRLADPSAKTEAQATPRRVSKDEAERVADKGTTKPEGGIKSGAKIGDQR